MDDHDQLKRATALWQDGYRHHMLGDLDGAIERYTQSIETYPTAEAYTYRGWAYHAAGRIDDAIAECKEAISVDPSFGNPYNDIGAYLFDKGQLDDAIPWLERAKTAKRYEPRHFPYMNLGRVYAAKGMAKKALEEFEGALTIEPDEPHCVEMVAKLRVMLN